LLKNKAKEESHRLGTTTTSEDSRMQRERKKRSTGKERGPYYKTLGCCKTKQSTFSEVRSGKGQIDQSNWVGRSPPANSIHSKESNDSNQPQLEGRHRLRLLKRKRAGTEKTEERVRNSEAREKGGKWRCSSTFAILPDKVNLQGRGIGSIA